MDQAQSIGLRARSGLLPPARKERIGHGPERCRDTADRIPGIRRGASDSGGIPFVLLDSAKARLTLRDGKPRNPIRRNHESLRRHR
ncbi:MAG TPA: hypothetical protein PLF73_06610, partial [Luteimonas sp.]|nr:hypothetical protein [Luteimonas sp.]